MGTCASKSDKKGNKVDSKSTEMKETPKTTEKPKETSPKNETAKASSPPTEDKRSRESKPKTEAEKPRSEKPKDEKPKTESKPKQGGATEKRDRKPKEEKPKEEKPKANDADKENKKKLEESDQGETASQETDRLYKTYMAEVDEHAALRKKYFDEASKAHAAGDGKLAKELSEKGKAETAKMEEAKEKAARAIYKGKNKNNDINVMDLHGLQVEMAIKIVSENLQTCKSKGFATADVIHGKGNHSGADGPKVKGAIRKWLDENGYKGKWVEISDGGAVQVTLK